jgi:hypothetical protein
MATPVITEKHERLIADIVHICGVANIPANYIHESSQEVCDPAEVKWVKNFYENRKNGINLVIAGHQENIENKLMVITAAFLRNYVDARFITVNQFIEEEPDPTVFLCPNFYIESATKGLTMPMHKIQRLYDLMVSRLARGRLSVLYVQDLALMKKQYGLLMANHIENHYNVVSGGPCLPLE